MKGFALVAGAAAAVLLTVAGGLRSVVLLGAALYPIAAFVARRLPGADRLT
ncbi:MAG: hypothetical protein QGH74_07630 [Candidatus Brocadiia bacterium]|nr:hypothetical protein [Candidatus Brocadiia bacterium]